MELTYRLINFYARVGGQKYIDMRTVIHLTEEEFNSFAKMVDQAAEMAKHSGTKVSEELADYLRGPKGEEPICIRFVS